MPQQHHQPVWQGCLCSVLRQTPPLPPLLQLATLREWVNFVHKMKFFTCLNFLFGRRLVCWKLPASYKQVPQAGLWTPCLLLDLPFVILISDCPFSVHDPSQFWRIHLNVMTFSNSEKQHTLSRTKAKRLRQFSLRDCHRPVVMKYCFEFVFCTSPAKLMECGNGARHLRKYGELIPGWRNTFSCV